MYGAAHIGFLLHRLVEGKASEAERLVVKEALLAGSISLAPGDRAVAITGDVTDAVIVTGDRNFVFKGDDAAALRQAVLALYPARLRQLPRGLPDFTGREPEVEKLLSLLLGSSDQVAIFALWGMGGVGKTALAVHVAHKLVGHYSEAQIVVDLAGTSDKPLSPMAAMGKVIAAFEPQAHLSDSPEEVAALYRSLLAGRQALLLLDNASDAAQVKDLLPPPPAVALVTSRRAINLPGLIPINLDVLAAAEAVDLLRTILGEGRAAEAEITTLADRCGHLPLALRAAGRFLVTHPDWEVGEYLETLAQEKERLGRLKDEDLEVEASLGLSAARLALENPEWARRWQMLTVFPGSFNRAGAAAVWEATVEEARDTLSELLNRSLVLFDPDTRRYHLHDLICLVARNAFSYGGASSDQATDSQRQAQAAARHAAYFEKILREANALYLQGGEALGLGLQLFDQEWDNIRAGQAWALAHADDDLEAAKICSAYPDAGICILFLRLHPRELIAWLETARSVAHRLGDRSAEGVHLGNLGLAYAHLGDYWRAIEYHEQALAISRAFGYLSGEGANLNSLGSAYYYLGDYGQAIVFLKQALDISRAICDRRGESCSLGCLGTAYEKLGDYRQAIAYHRQYLDIARKIGDRQGEGNAMGGLGTAYYSLGDPSCAIEHYLQYLAIAREIGDRRGEGNALGGLGLAYMDLRDYRKAIEYHKQDLAIAWEIDDLRKEGIALGNLGNVYLVLGKHHHAIKFFEQQLVVSRKIGNTQGKANALGGLGLAYAHLRDHRWALNFYEQQLAISREIGDCKGEGCVLFNMSLTLDDLGERQRAISWAGYALEIFEQIGSPNAEQVHRQLAKWRQEGAPPLPPTQS